MRGWGGFALGVMHCINFYVIKWLFCQHLSKTYDLCMKVDKSRHHSTHLGGSRSLDAHILSNPLVNKMHNEKKKIDWMEKKIKIEWDELQVETQHLHDVQWCLLIQLNCDNC